MPGPRLNERPLHHSLALEEQPSALEIATALLGAIQANQPVSLRVGDSEPLVVPQNIQRAMLDLCSLMAVDQTVSVVMLASRRHATLGEINRHLRLHLFVDAVKDLPFATVGEHKYYEVGAVLEAGAAHGYKFFTEHPLTGKKEVD